MGPKKVRKKPAKRHRRGTLDMKRRAVSARLSRACGQSVPKGHRWMLDFQDAGLEQILQASEKLLSMKEQGLEAVSARVLSTGLEPHERHVQLLGAPESLADKPELSLYSQLCDWMALAQAAKAQASRFFAELEARDFFVPVEIDTDSDDESCWAPVLLGPATDLGSTD